MLSHLSSEDSRFNDFLTSAIDKTLSNVLGEEAKKATLSYLEDVYSLNAKYYFEELEILDSVLRKLFGSVATIIENQILKRIYQQINVQNPENDTFLNLVENARNEYCLMVRASGGFQSRIDIHSQCIIYDRIRYYNYARSLMYLATSLMALYMTATTYIQFLNPEHFFADNTILHNKMIV